MLLNSSIAVCSYIVLEVLIDVNLYIVNNVGPQKVFPVPEGIINHQGKNTVALSLWAQDVEGARLGGLELSAVAVVQTGYGKVEASEQPAWKERTGAY